MSKSDERLGSLAVSEIMLRMGSWAPLCLVGGSDMQRALAPLSTSPFTFGRP